MFFFYAKIFSKKLSVSEISEFAMVSYSRG